MMRNLPYSHYSGVWNAQIYCRAREQGKLGRSVTIDKINGKRLILKDHTDSNRDDAHNLSLGLG